MINKIILTVTMVNLVNATVLTVKNNDDNYWTNERINSAVPFSYQMAHNQLGALPPFILPVGYEQIHCPSGWQDNASQQQCIFPSINANSGYKGWFSWFSALVFVIDPSKACPTNTVDDGGGAVFNDGRHCSTNVYLDYENTRIPSYTNGVFSITYPKLTRTTLNQNTRPDWNTGKLYFTAGSTNAYCSAAVIRPNIIITSAHCVEHNGTLFTNFSFQSARGTSTISNVVYNHIYDVITLLDGVRFDYAFLKLNTTVTPGYFGYYFGTADNSTGLTNFVFYLSYVDNNIYTSLLLANVTYPGVYTFEYNKGTVTGGEQIVLNYNSSANTSGNLLISIISVATPEDASNTKSIAYAPIFDATTQSLLNQISN